MVTTLTFWGEVYRIWIWCSFIFSPKLFSSHLLGSSRMSAIDRQAGDSTGKLGKLVKHSKMKKKREYYQATKDRCPPSGTVFTAGVLTTSSFSALILLPFLSYWKAGGFLRLSAAAASLPGGGWSFFFLVVPTAVEAFFFFWITDSSLSWNNGLVDIFLKNERYNN